ncbi:MAG: cytochrome P450 [Anaerolineaceae bacterium]|nr:cytochrome P450 [Anaerolineaceae bacterium]
MTPYENIDITSREFKADPFPFYAYLRAEAPVYQTIVKMPDKKRPVWIVSRYDDVLAALKDDRFAKDKRNVMTPEQLKKQPYVPAAFKAIERNMLDLDAPDHTRLRGLVHKAFTPRLVEDMRARIERLSNELLDEMERKDEIDLIHDYALPIPLTIIGEILGVPKEDAHKFHQWSKKALSMQSMFQALLATPSLLMFMRYLRHLFNLRRADPQDDLITALVEAEEAGNQMSEDELLAMVFILLIAGHETTVNLIGTGSLELLRHPDQLVRLRDNPTLIKPAVEELVRFGTPVETATERYAREDITIAGVTIPKGEMMFAALASANRDENVFANPDVLDITREPNRHLSFGQGAHYCVGAPLARLEGSIAINNLVQRFPNLRLATSSEDLVWRKGMTIRGLEKLPVKV